MGSAVEAYVTRLLAAEALVFVFPVWCYGVPAILKGFFDRVFRIHPVSPTFLFR
jgi:putative NADPH-quinone reductase